MDAEWNFTWTGNSSILNDSIPTATSSAKNANIPQWYESGRIQIPLYAIIFMLAVVGNTLVILTLVSNNKHYN